MRRRLSTRPGERRPRAKRRRWFNFGRRVALLAVLAQAAIAAIHQIPHEHAPSTAVGADAPAAAAPAHAHHGHGNEHERPAPAHDHDAPPCAVGQTLQHLAAVFPIAAGSVLIARRGRERQAPRRPIAAAVHRAGSQAQPRAPPTAA
jgi:hypothetical protein